MGLLDQLFPAIQAQESSNDPFAVSPKGAFGLMQLMPNTARKPGFGVKPYDFGTSNPSGENQRVGRDYFSALYNKYQGDVPTALMAYNWGPGNVDKWLAGGRQGPVPTETQNYVSKIMNSVQGVSPSAAPTATASAQPMLLGPASNLSQNVVDMAPQPPAPVPAPQTGQAPMANDTPKFGGLLGGDMGNLGPMLMALGGGIAGGATQGWGAGIGAGLQGAQQAYIERLGLAYKLQQLELERRKAQLMGIKDVPDLSGTHHLFNVNPDDNTASPVDTSGQPAAAPAPGAPMNVTPPVPAAPAAPMAATPPMTTPVATPAAPTGFNEDAIKQYPDIVQARARAMAVGDLPIPTSSRNNPLNNAATSALLAYTNGKPDTSLYAKKQAMAMAASSGDIGKATTAFRATIGHVGELVDSINNLNNGTSPLVTAGKNAYATTIGGPSTVDRQNKLAQLEANLHTVLSEAAKVWAVGQGSEGELRDWEKAFNVNAPKQTQIAAVQKLVDMLQTKGGALQQQVDAGMGSSSTPAPKIITPELKSVLDGYKKLSTSVYETPTSQSIKLLQAQPTNKELRAYFEKRFGPADQYLTPAAASMGM